MTYAVQRDLLVRTRQELLVVGVRECENFYATLVQQELTRTEEFDHADWIKTSVSVVANNAEAPDGTMTADTVTFNATSDAIGQLGAMVVTSKAFTASVWLRIPSGSQTVTLRVFNSGITETGTKQVTLSTTWTRFYVHKLFSGVPVDTVVFDVIRTAGDTVTDLQMWGANLHRNPGDKNREVVFTYRNRVAEVISTLSVNVSRCEAADAGDGNRCFYSRSTCQDPDNFNAGNLYEDTARGKGIREYRFCKKDSPLPLSGVETLPYITTVASASQEISADRAVTVNERMTYKMEDDAGPGVWNVRQQLEGGLVNTQTGAGTFWRRWRYIYRNYSNPECYAIRKVGFIEPGVTEASFQIRGKFLIRDLTSSDSGIRLVVGDRLKLTRKSIPSKIDQVNVLGATITSGATSMTVTDASQITPVADNASSADPDYVVTLEIDPDGTSEKVNVTAIDLNTNTLTIQRGRWGTTAAAHTKAVPFREVAEYGTERTTPSVSPLGKNPIDILIEQARQSGLSMDEIDVTTLESERDTWLPSTVDPTSPVGNIGTGILLRRTVTEPTEIDTLQTEIRDLCLVFLWVSETQQLTGKVFAPKTPLETYTELTDDSNLIAGSIEVEDNEEETRISRAVIAYNLTVGEQGDDIADYQEVRVELDIDAEEREYYGEPKLKQILSKWLRPGDTASAAYFTSHILDRFRHGARVLRARLEIKDDDIQLGDFVKVNTGHIQDAKGNNLQSIMQVVKKKPVSDGVLQIECLDTGLFRRYWFYALDGLSDYASATEANKEYAYHADDNGLVGSTGEAGYLSW